MAIEFSCDLSSASSPLPHVWEHSLFYLASRAIYGSGRYRLGRSDFVTRACRARRAPLAAGVCG